MFDQQDTVGLILAYKHPMTVYGTISAIRRLTLAVRKAGIHPIIIVTGKQSYDVERSMSDFGVIFICGEESRAVTELDYLRCGLELAQKLYKKAVVVSTEYPIIAPGTIHGVLQYEHEAVVTMFNEQKVYPMKLEAEQMNNLLDQKEISDLEELYRLQEPHIIFHQTTDVGVVVKKNERTVSEQLIIEHNQMLLQPYILAFMETEKTFFDQRILLLLKLIHEFSSVKTACKHMAMSYAKAWDALNYLESMIGYQVVLRSHGGKRGGRTVLTEEGKHLIISFEQYEKMVKEYSRSCFAKVFPEFWKARIDDF